MLLVFDYLQEPYNCDWVIRMNNLTLLETDFHDIMFKIRQRAKYTRAESAHTTIKNIMWKWKKCWIENFYDVI